MAELLAPAGNLEKLIFAANYGADAVYFGLDHFSLRNFSSNFTMDQAQEGLDYLHARGLKGYCTLNIYPFGHEYKELLKRAAQLAEIGVDAFIVADLGVMFELRKQNLGVPLHVSTQANTLSAQTVKAYAELGAKRVNLARELSIDQIASIQHELANTGVETEVFIHGAVCFSYSGRCAISDYVTGRRANRGECTQPCRWKYRLEEEKRPGIYMPVAEDERGLYLFNTKDLALFSYVSRLQELGVSSLKIEGRMKSIHYIATVLSLYRRVLNGEEISEDRGLKHLSRIRNRGYSHGFMKGSVGPEDYRKGFSGTESPTVFIGKIIESHHLEQSVMTIRNKTFAGGEVEVLKPDGTLVPYTLPDPLTTTDGDKLSFVNHGKSLLLPKKFPPFSILRRNEVSPVPDRHER